MTRRLRWILPAIAACAGIGACKKGGTEEFPRLVLEASYPVTGAFREIATVCSGAKATLVSLDTDGDSGFEYRFLFDAGGNELWGCGDDAPCTGPIDGELPVPRRVMIEGITVSPNEYGDRRHDVACRGMADAKNGMGAILSPPLAFPGLEDATHAVVPMLRVGAFNGLFSTEMPAGFGVAASLLVAPGDREDVLGDLRVSTGGIVVAAGGSDLANTLDAHTGVWEFHPWEIAYELVATMNTGHTYGDAQPFLDADGQPHVLFVGGIGTAGRAVLRADSYSRGIPVTQPHAQSGERYFPGVAPVETAEGPAIAVLNGCWGPTGAHTAYQHDFEVFYPIAAPAGCANQGSPGFCTKNTGVSIEGRCQAGILPLEDGRIWFATGVRDDNQMSDYTYVFDETAQQPFLQLDNLQTPVRLAPSVPFGEDRVALFGGFVSAPGQADATTDRWTILHPDEGALAEGRLLTRRGYMTATMLLDGRVLVAGGFETGVGFLDTAEIVERATEELGGQAEWIAPAGHSTCDPGVDCERMSEIKYGHAATRIEGSATWLEGAVLLSGGTTSPAGTSELFVPAYHCDGTRPVNRLDGARVPDVELCDRLRDPPAITDPRKPKRF